MSKLSSKRSGQTPLQLLQDRFRLVKLSGRFYIVDMEEVRLIKSGRVKKSLEYFEKPSADLLMKRFLEGLSTPSDPKRDIQSFWIHPSTKIYERVAFSPVDNDHNTLNLWTPTPIEPRPGIWTAIYKFLAEVICSNDSVLLTYLLNYLAHMLQKPADKPGVMIVLLGGQGTGKGMFFRLLQRIWPTTSLMVSDVKRVLGNFNDVLAYHYVVFFDEALFVGDKASTERMKSLTTEPRIVIEGKYQPTRDIDSYHRFFAASNAEHFIHTDADDRRLMVFRVSSERQRDHAYFNALMSSFDGGDMVAAFVHDLLVRDLSNFNVRDQPSTREHAKQKLRSLSGFRRFWFEVLMLGDLRGRGRGFTYLAPREEFWDQPRFIETTELMDFYLHADQTAARYGSFQQQELHTIFEQICSSAKAVRKLVESRFTSREKVQKRGFELPHIDAARQDFERWAGVRIDWEAGFPLGTTKVQTSVSQQVFEDAAWWTSALLNWQINRRLPLGLVNEFRGETPMFST